jgi:uncharacterized membrane protein
LKLQLAGTFERRWAAALVFTVVAAAAVAPMAHWGVFACAYDAPIHLTYLDHLRVAWAHGDLYPRWLPGLNFGQGSPVFLVQYPLPYYVLGALGSLAAYSFVCMSLAGWWCYLWLRRRLEAGPALVGGLAYLLMPYYLLHAGYVRGDIGELCAVAAMPLVLHGLERPAGRWPDWWVSCAGLTLLWLGHPPTAAVAMPLWVLYPLLRRSRPAALRAVWAMATSMGVAAFYLARLAWHRADVMAHPLFSYADNYVFPDNHVFDMVVRWLPSAEPLRRMVVYEPVARSNSIYPQLYCLLTAWAVGLLGICVLLLRRRWRGEARLWTALAAGATYLVLPWSDWIIRLAPILRVMQYPGRYLVLVGLGVAWLTALAVADWRAEGCRGRGAGRAGAV